MKYTMYKSKPVGICLFVSLGVRQCDLMFILWYFLSICRLQNYAFGWQYYIGVYIVRPWKIIQINNNAQE